MSRERVEPRAAGKAQPGAGARSQGRHQLAERLLKLQAKIADDLLAIDDCKAALRAIAEETGEGFTEQVEGLGSVEVSAGRAAKLKGLLPALQAEIFLKLPKKQREKLIADGVVAMEEIWSSAAKPSVTVRL